jgi:hypothetical protein
MKAAPAVLATLLILSGTQAHEMLPEAARPKPLKAEYGIYSGELGDARVPTKTERKMYVAVSGQPAKEIFDSLYPDAKQTCSSEPGERLRSKGPVWCMFAPSSGYQCFFGLNLRTGASIAGGIC